MDVIRTQNGDVLTLAVSGRLDSVTAPQLETGLTESLAGVKTLILDLEKLEYLSSAGLRIVLMLQKAMSKQGEMTVRRVCPDVMEIFDMTGFASIIRIEPN